MKLLSAYILFQSFIIPIFSSCIAGKKLTTIDCRLNEESSQVVRIVIPKYKKQQIINADAEPGIEYIFWYSDSTAIYVSSFRGGTTLNYENIRNLKNGYNNRFFSDSLNLFGNDTKGKYWREVKMNGIYAGYYKAVANEKSIFDMSLDSLKIK